MSIASDPLFVAAEVQWRFDTNSAGFRSQRPVRHHRHGLRGLRGLFGQGRHDHRRRGHGQRHSGHGAPRLA